MKKVHFRSLMFCLAPHFTTHLLFLPCCSHLGWICWLSFMAIYKMFHWMVSHPGLHGCSRIGYLLFAYLGKSSCSVSLVQNMFLSDELVSHPPTFLQLLRKPLRMLRWKCQWRRMQLIYGLGGVSWWRCRGSSIIGIGYLQLTHQMNWCIWKRLVVFLVEHSFHYSADISNL